MCGLARMPAKNMPFSDDQREHSSVLRVNRPGAGAIFLGGGREVLYLSDHEVPALAASLSRLSLRADAHFLRGHWVVAAFQLARIDEGQNVYGATGARRALVHPQRRAYSRYAWAQADAAPLFHVRDGGRSDHDQHRRDHYGVSFQPAAAGGDDLS